MARLIGTVAALIALCLAAPAVVSAAQAAVPLLISVLFLSSSA